MMSNRVTNTYHAHNAWNKYHPDDPIFKGGGNVIHHIDNNNKNNCLDNLQKMTRAEHTILHNTGRVTSEKCRNAISKANKGHTRWLGKKHSEETKKKMSESHSGENHHLFGKKRDHEICKKISESLKNKYKTEVHYLVGRKNSKETKMKRAESVRKYHQNRRAALCQ